jgi:predicted nucleic-acid-binding Zn-ribbon protein
MDKQRQEEIIKILTSKGAIQPCPRCANPQFELVGEAIIQLNMAIGPHLSGHPQIPVILVACKRCGYIAQHTKKVLDPNAEPKF